ncbi:hypothetical protein [Kitasatospora sp. NPDC050543]|uniref:hypothetical protein n=1 Tax=Kitasatospora sp. NPDC050543 TaxID=3364054 RepID=UPI0037BBF955
MGLQNTQLSVAASGLLVGSPAGAGATPQMPLDYRVALGLAGGTGLGQADRLWTATRTLNASANEDLDLNGTALTDGLGVAVALARVKGLIVAAAASNTNNVIVGGAASNGFVSWVSSATDKVTVRPGGVLALFCTDATGYAVTGATADLLRIANSGAGTSVTYDIVVIGSSA